MVFKILYKNILILMILFLFVIVGNFILFYMYVKQEDINHTKNEIKVVANLITQFNKDAILNNNDTILVIHMLNIVKNSNVSYVEIYSFYSKKMFIFYKDKFFIKKIDKSLIKSSKFINLDKETVMYQEPLIFNGNNFGYIKIYYKIKSFAEDIKKLDKVIVVFFIISFIFIFIISYFYSKYILNIIYKLNESFESLWKDKKFIPIKNNRNDEFGELINNFNKMGSIIIRNEIYLKEEIKRKTKELEELNKQLEQRVEEEIEKNRQKDYILFQQSKQAQLGEMVNMIAHQYRQPLNVINTIVYNLQLDYQLSECGNCKDLNIEEVVDQITQNTKYLSNTINDFLNFSKPEVEKQEFYIKDVFDDVLKMVSPQLKNNNIEFILNIKDNYIIEGYKSELKQVLLNLISNSKDVLIKKDSNRKIIVDVYDSKIDFYDNGGGIEEQHMEKIFNPYFTTKVDEGGTGLGLFMSYEILKTHFKATMTAYNKDNESHFLIDFWGYLTSV